MVAEVNLTSESIKKDFDHWRDNDGTKAGLEKILLTSNKTMTKITEGDLVKTVKLKHTPANFRVLKLKTCANCKHVDAHNAEEILGCNKYPENKTLNKEIYYNTTCDDWSQN